jgi:hypothetical protein
VGKSDREIAKLCRVSAPFVSAKRNPDVKKQQDDNRKKHALKTECNPITLGKKDVDNQDPTDGAEFSEEEIQELRLKDQAQREMVDRIAESDDSVRQIHEENKSLLAQLAQKEITIRGLMNEKSVLIKEVRRLQLQIDRLNKGK